MQQVLFLFKKQNSRIEHLKSILSKEYSILEVHDAINAMNMLEEMSFNDVVALIVDYPSQCENFDKLKNYVEGRNTFMFNLPIILYSDVEHIKDDDKYLDENIVGIFLTEESERIILKRIGGIIKFSNSSSFDEFSDMLKKLPSLIYLKDTKGRYAFCSQNWHHLNPQNKNQVIRGKTDFEIRKDKKNAQIAYESDRKVIESGKGMNYIIKEEDEDEGLDYLQVIKEPLKDEKGNVTGIIAIINNVTNEELVSQELRRKSITDNLTGAYNREYFNELCLEHEGNLEVPLTVISADCDGLKAINDKYGHLSGDKYICHARDAIISALPDNAYLFRMGGDEFLAIIPYMKQYDAALLIKKILKNTKKYKTKEYSLKMSIGSHTITRKNASMDRALALSDKAMYKMKREHKKK